MQQQQQQPQAVVSPPLMVTAVPVAQARTPYSSRVPPWVLKGHVIMGALQLAVGCAVFVLGIVNAAAGSRTGLSVIGSGIWSGVFFIIAGICGLVAGKGRGCTLGCVITCLVFSIIASSLAFTAMVLESIVTAGNRYTFEHQGDSLFLNMYLYMTRSIDSGSYRTVYVTGVICSLLFSFEFVLAIVHSAYACRASCCCVQSPPQQAQFQQQQQVFYTGQPINLPSNVVGYYPAQPAPGFPGQAPGYYPPAPAYSGYAPSQQGPGYPGYPPAQQAPGYPGYPPAQQAPGYPGHPGQQETSGDPGPNSGEPQPPPYDVRDFHPGKF